MNTCINCSKSRVGKLLAHRPNLAHCLFSYGLQAMNAFLHLEVVVKKKKSVTHENFMKLKFVSINKAL